MKKKNKNKSSETKPCLIRKPIESSGEYIYGAHAVYTALLANKRPHYHRLFVHPPPLKYESDTTHTIRAPERITKRPERYHKIVQLAQQMDIPIEHCDNSEMNHLAGKKNSSRFFIRL